MKPAGYSISFTHRSLQSGGIPVATRRPAPKTRDRATEVEATVDVAKTASLAGPLRVVGILAFCQALIFLVLFLFFCARAGAASVAKPEPVNPLELISSTYVPQNARDPFGSEIVKGGDTNAAAPRVVVHADALKLQGILYNKLNPSALVNDQLLELNKTAKIHTDQGDMDVKAVMISREFVTLDVGGQKVELR